MVNDGTLVFLADCEQGSETVLACTQLKSCFNGHRNRMTEGCG